MKSVFRLCAFLALGAAAVGQVTPPAAGVAEAAPTTRKLVGLVYARTSEAELKLDLQVPLEHGGRPLPVVIWIHGGGWTEGKRGFSPLWPMSKQGYAVASISYRFSQQAVFPAQIEDAKAAVRWLRAHAAEYNLDPERIGVAGESAGALLAALLGTAGDVKAWETGENLEFSSRVQAVVDLCGPTDFTIEDKDADLVPGLLASGDPAKAQGALQITSRRPIVSRLLGGYDLEKARAASPVTYISKEAPPFLLVHGDNDYLVPIRQSRAFQAALVKAGVEAELIVVPGAGHGFGRFSPKMAEQVGAFFDAKLRGRRSVSN